MHHKSCISGCEEEDFVVLSRGCQLQAAGSAIFLYRTGVRIFGEITGVAQRDSSYDACIVYCKRLIAHSLSSVFMKILVCGEVAGFLLPPGS